MSRSELLNRRWRLQIEIRLLERKANCSRDDTVRAQLVGLQRELVDMNRKLANDRRMRLRVLRQRKGVSQ